MRLLIKQRVFSWTDSYDVYDEKGNACYFVRAEFFSLGHQIRVYHKQSGVELGSIHQRLLTLLPTFDVVMDGREIGSVCKNFRLFSQSYDVDFCGWEVEGDLLGWDYQVCKDGKEMLRISKQLLTWGDTYVLEYDDPSLEMPGLLLVLAIDAANCDE